MQHGGLSVKTTIIKELKNLQVDYGYKVQAIFIENSQNLGCLGVFS